MVEVGDDGCGFEPGQRHGDGLTHLADRVRALGGTLHLQASPGAGATVTAILPIADDGDDA